MKFTWGQVIRRIKVDMDDQQIEVTKFHPWVSKNGTVKVGEPNLKEVQFHVETMAMSFHSMQSLMVAWIAYKNLGLNQYRLVEGLCRALEIDKHETQMIEKNAAVAQS